jgi:hypothetical protein
MMKATLRTLKEATRQGPDHSEPEPVDGSDVLDWDVTIETPPSGRTGALWATLEYAGRSKPDLIADPLPDD